MDAKSEDTMVRQIEKNLTNNINENLFLSGRAASGSSLAVGNSTSFDKASEEMYPDEEPDTGYPLVSYDYITKSPGLTRAEYIRQAREACLRQLSLQQVYSRPYDVNYMEHEAETKQEEQPDQRNEKVISLYQNEEAEEKITEEYNKVHEVAAYRSLIIRSICAILLFLCIFAVDKFHIKIGDLTDTMIKDYVIGNDALKNLENFLVSWLK